MNTEPLVRRYGILPLTVALAVVLVGTACRDSGGSRRGEAATPAMISAPAVPLGPQFLVKADASNAGVAMDSLGRFLVLWSATDTAGPGIFGQRFDASGGRRGGEFRLLTDAAHGVDAQKRPSVAMDKDGNFVVAWTTSSSGHDDHDIVAQRFAADGVARGSAFAVNTNTAGTQLSPSVAMGADGNFVVAWTSEVQDGAGVFAQRYYAGGAPLGTEFRVDADVGGRALNPSVGIDALGGHIVVWETALAEGAGYDIVGQRYDAYGNRTGDTFQFVPNTGAEPRFPGVATDTAGNFFVTWADGDDFLVAFDGVFVRRYSAAGAGSGEGLRISGGMLRVHAPRMAIDAAGNSVVVWDGARSADEQAIFARRFRPARAGEIVAASGDNGGVGSTAGSGGGASGPGPDGMPEDGEPVLAEGGGMGAAKATLDCVTYTPERLYMAPAGLPSSELADALGKLPGGTALSTIITGLAAGVFPIGTLEFDEGINLDVFSGLVSDNERRIEISDAGDTAACNTDVGIGGCARLQIGTSQGGKLYAGAVTVGVTNKLPSGAILDNYSAVDYNDAQHRGQLLLAINGNLQQINDALKDLEYAPDPDIDGNGTPYIYNGSNPEKITATLVPNAPKTCTADTSVTWEIEVRVLRVNDFPDLTPDNPVEVAAPVDTEVTVGNAITVPTVIDPGTVTDPDVDEAGPANQRRMLLIGALSCGQPITQDTSHGFHFGSAAFDDIGSGLKDLLILAGIDDTTVLPGVGGKTNSELLIELLDAALPTVDDGTGTQKELSELPLATGNNFDFKSAFGAIGTIGDMQDAVSKIYFQHDKTDDTCELLTVVSDLGNWGLPLQYVGSPPTGIEIPLIGFDFNTRVFETQRSATVSGTSVTEGNAGTTTVDVTVTLGAAATGNETLTLSTTGGTATGGTDCNVAGTDYLTLTDAAVTFAAGDTTATVPVTVCGDELIEVDETITVTLADAQNVSIADATGSATISNDDLALVTLSALPVNIAEAAGTSTVTATLSQASAVDVTVNLTLGGSATVTTDYTLATSIVIPANDTSASVTLTAVQDTTDEANESVVINISTVDNATEDGVQQATVTITDDDDGPTVTLSAVPTSIDEAAGTSTITATLAQASAQQVTVNLAVSGTATGGDYTLPLSIVIPPNDTTGAVTLTATQDAIDEADETVIVDIDTVINATESASQQVTVTITDDDDPPTVTLSAVPASIAEAAGTSTITATLAQASGQDVTVNLTLSGTATGGDYTLASSIVIPAGDTSNSTTLTATQDANDEADETVIIDVSSVTNATESGAQQVTVTITDDDDGPAVTLSAVPASIGEAAGTSTITATLAQTSTQVVTVTLAVSGTATAADYTLGLSIVVPANTLTGSVTLTATQDATDEADETVVIDIDGVTNGGEDGVQQVTVTITDDDDPPTVTLSATPASIAEAAGTSTITATVAQASAQIVTVNLAVSGAATSGADYTLPANIVIPANSTTASITLTALQDAIDEADEPVVIDISGVTNGSEDAVQQVTVTITDDDDPPTVTLSAVPTSVAEAAGTSTITATLAQASAQIVTVNLAVSGAATSGADYTLATSIVIPANSTTASVTLTAVPDAIDEADEPVVIDISSVTNATEDGVQQVTVTITDDDDGPAVTLSAVPTSIAEAAGTATITATLSQASAQDVTVNLAVGGTSDGTDYTLPLSILIPASSSSASATLTAVQDAIDEADETVIIDISTVVNATEDATQQVTVTVTDDDGPAVSLSAVPASIAEAAGTSMIVATLAQASAQDVTVNLSASGTAAGGDYTLPASIFIAAGGTTASVMLTAVQDAVDEADETVVIDIASVTNGIESGTQQVTVIITDDDVTTRVASVTVGSTAEGNAGMTMVNATVTLDAAANGNETLTLSTMDGTASGGANCAAGIDYIDVAGAAVNFAVGETTQLVPITVCGDSVVEGNETFSVMLGNAVNVNIGTGTASSTISNDDAAPPTATAVPTATATATPTPTASSTPSPSPSPTPTSTPQPTASPTATPTPPTGVTPTPIPTTSPTPGVTPTPVVSPTAAPTASPSATPTAGPTAGSINSGEGRFGGSFDLLSVFAGLILLLIRRGRLMLAVLLGGVLLPVPSHAESEAEATARVNLREAPDKGVQVVTVLEAGQRVRILERGPQYTRVAGTTVLDGYLPSQYLRPCADEAQPDCAVTTTVVNVRDGKGIEHALVGRLLPDTSIFVRGRDGDYALIHHEAEVAGYVATSYLREIDPTPVAAPDTATPKFSDAEPVQTDAVDANPPAADEPDPLPAPVVAEAVKSGSRSTEFSPGWQLGVAAGSAISELDRADVQRRFSQAGVDVEVSDYDGQDLAIEVFARYEFTPAWGMQFGYLDLGEFETRFSADPAEAAALAAAAKDEYPVAGDGVTAAVFGQLGSGAWRVTANLGVFLSLDRDVEIRLGDQRLSAEGPGSSVLLSLGTSYLLTHEWRIQADVRALDLNGWIAVPAVGLTYAFD